MTIPTVPSPEQIPETTVPMTQSPGLSHLEDEFRAFSDDQIRANGGRVSERRGEEKEAPANNRRNQPTTYQEDSFGGTNSPFDQGSRNDMQLRNPNLYSNACHGQSSHVSPQQLEDMSGTHPFEHCPDRRVQAPEFGEFQWIPERGIARSSKNRIRGSKKWPCDHGGCDKRYGRRQEAIRHMRDKHGVSPKCFICGFKWTRAEKIKGHLLSKHQHHFTEEERQEIYHLRGQNNTIDLLERLEITGR